VTRTFDPRFLDLLEENVVPSWSGRVWRQVLGNSDPLRANLRGARWNPPGTEALYCSLSPDTAEAEIDYLLSRQPVPTQEARVTIELTVDLTRVVDLQQIEPLEAFGIQRPDIVGMQYESPQLIGRAVAWLGCAGLLIPSARHPGSNLVIFTNAMAPGDTIDPVVD